jgi:hypothetical protein
MHSRQGQSRTPSTGFARRVIALCVALGVGAPALLAQRGEPAIERYIQDSLGVTPRELDDVRRGSVLSKILPTANPRDVTVFGMVELPISRAAFAPRMGDARRIIALRAPTYEIFDEPPTAANVQRVAVDASEFRDLQRCRLEHCNFKLPAAAMREFANTVSWTSDSAKAQVDSLARANVLRFITDYRTGGNAAMVEYDDNHAVRSSDAFAALLDQSTYLRDFVPELRDYLESYPLRRPESVRDVFFWEENRLPRLRPTLTLSHMVMYTMQSGTPLVAIKQVYADHYFEGALEVYAAFDAPATDTGPAMYLISIRRYRFDALPNGGFLNLRGRVRGRLADAVKADLQRERQDVEGARR